MIEQKEKLFDLIVDKSSMKYIKGKGALAPKIEDWISGSQSVLFAAQGG